MLLRENEEEEEDYNVVLDYGYCLVKAFEQQPYLTELLQQGRELIQGD